MCDCVTQNPNPTPPNILYKFWCNYISHQKPRTNHLNGIDRCVLKGSCDLSSNTPVSGTQHKTTKELSKTKSGQSSLQHSHDTAVIKGRNVLHQNQREGIHQRDDQKDANNSGQSLTPCNSIIVKCDTSNLNTSVQCTTQSLLYFHAGGVQVSLTWGLT